MSELQEDGQRVEKDSCPSSPLPLRAWGCPEPSEHLGCVPWREKWVDEERDLSMDAGWCGVVPNSQTRACTRVTTALCILLPGRGQIFFFFCRRFLFYSIFNTASVSSENAAWDE